MSVPLVFTPDVAYATKPNIVRPGTQTEATAAEARAETILNERFTTITSTVDAGAVKVGTPG